MIQEYDHWCGLLLLLPHIDSHPPQNPFQMVAGAVEEVRTRTPPRGIFVLAVRGDPRGPTKLIVSSLRAVD